MDVSKIEKPSIKLFVTEKVAILYHQVFQVDDYILNLPSKWNCMQRIQEQCVIKIIKIY
jgi:hypothetical protein